MNTQRNRGRTENHGDGMPRFGSCGTDENGLAKYTFYRHDENNSAWTTNHQLLNASILDEYLRVYRARTEWLSNHFPDNAPTWRYFEWSFMISMVEKINRLKLSKCERQMTLMKRELAKHQNEFLDAPEILDFEKEWMKSYVTL